MMNTQSQNVTRQPNPSAWKYFWNVVTAIGVVVGIAAAALTFYLWFEANRSIPTVDFEIVDNQCLTNVSEVPGLDSRFFYKGGQVKNLWVSRVRLVNVCRRNIIGTTGHDLMTSNVCFSVSNGFRMMAAEFESRDFDAQIGCGTNVFSLAFDKWRPNQECVIKIYCEGVLGTSEDSDPQFTKTFDPFTQGDINIQRYRTKRPSCNIMQRLPHRIAAILTWIGVGVYGVILAFCLWGFFLKIGWWRMFARRCWEAKHFMVVTELIAAQTAKDDKNSLSIDEMPEEFWVQNAIEKPPKSSPFVKSGRINWEELMPWLILIFIFAMLSVISLLALIRL